MQNQQIAALFEELADLLEIQGANAFRVRAYRNAARTLEGLSESAEEIIASTERSLTDLEGIGKDLATKIEAIVKTGTLQQLDELRTQIRAERLRRALKAYDPNQPRVPAGNSDGGQWTSGGEDNTGLNDPRVISDASPDNRVSRIP